MRSIANNKRNMCFWRAIVKTGLFLHIVEKGPKPFCKKSCSQFCNIESLIDAQNWLYYALFAPKDRGIGHSSSWIKFHYLFLHFSFVFIFALTYISTYIYLYLPISTYKVWVWCGVVCVLLFCTWWNSSVCSSTTEKYENIDQKRLKFSFFSWKRGGDKKKFVPDY